MNKQKRKLKKITSMQISKRSVELENRSAMKQIKKIHLYRSINALHLNNNTLENLSLALIREMLCLETSAQGLGFQMCCY